MLKRKSSPKMVLRARTSHQVSRRGICFDSRSRQQWAPVIFSQRAHIPLHNCHGHTKLSTTISSANTSQTAKLCSVASHPPVTRRPVSANRWLLQDGTIRRDIPCRPYSLHLLLLDLIHAHH